MTGPDHRLRASLRDLAEAVEPADLYDGAVRRSRRIARREAAIGTTAALAALVLLAGGLWHSPRGKTGEPPRAVHAPVASPSAGHSASALPPAAPSPAATTPRHTGVPSAEARKRKNQPRVVVTTSPPQSRKLTDLRGHVFYQETGPEPDVVRLSPADGVTRTVLPDAPSRVGISPDGSRIAYASGDALLVARTAGGPADRVTTGVTTTDQAPAWSPDGARVLVRAGRPAVVEVGTRALTALPAELGAGRHFRWSGDGNRLVYATSYCALEVAGNAGGSGFSVPVLGDRQPVDNPDGLAACKPTSVDATGERVTVPLQSTGETGADSPDTADAVVDTVTGDLLPLPVTDSVVGTVFAPDGNLLVRSRHDDITRLSLFAPDGALLVQATEPATLRDLDLLAYTR